jgi:ribA/ribD-fused uncharacterized protein
MNRLTEMETYNKKNCAWFFSKKDNNFNLSNMSVAMRVQYGGKIWHSSEQLYQACKYAGNVNCVPATSVGKKVQPNVRQRIIDSTNPMGAKMTQKCAVKAGLIRDDWEDVKIENMLYVLKLKLKNNPVAFRRALLSTGQLDIVEISRKDKFWGTVEIENNVLEGSNVLGKLLMDVRTDMDNILEETLNEPPGFWLP